ncbi:transcriptional regulator [Paraburkholderia hospita]|nr:transcriptional regulator [Paraburkholderia hospita]
MKASSPNPASLGLAAFALTTWLLSMINAGWFSGTSLGLVLAVAFAFGGSTQIIAGIMEIPRGNTFGATAFLSYGAFWWSFALFVLFLLFLHVHVPAAFVGWYLFLWGVFTFYMWIATFPSSRALQYVFVALWATFFLLAASEWFGSAALRLAGGYGGLLTAALAFYLSAAEIINETFGHTVLPVGAKPAAVETGTVSVATTVVARFAD